MSGLCGKIVKSQRGEETHYGFRETLANLCKRMIFFHGYIWSRVQSPANPLQLSAGNQFSDFWA
jgi:hypothetical protein